MHRSIVCTILFTTLLFTTPQIVVADCPPQWNYAFGQVGMNSSVTALCVYAGKLHAGGFFTTAGGVSANRVARWEGANWQPLGTGVTGGSVWCVTEFNGELIAGGFFTTAGGVSVSNIARWNGTSWQAMGAGLNNFVWALAVHNGTLRRRRLHRVRRDEPFSRCSLEWNCMATGRIRRV